MKTNIEHRTSNVESRWPRWVIQCSMFDVRRSIAGIVEGGAAFSGHSARQLALVAARNKL